MIEQPALQGPAPGLLQRLAATFHWPGKETGRCTPHSGHRRQDSPLHAAVHPGRNSPSSVITRHLVDVHHHFLRQHLPWIDSLLDKIEEQGGNPGRPWPEFRNDFRALKDELLNSALRDECLLFPLIEQREADPASTRALPPALVQAVQLAERSHARCLHLLWRLFRLTSNSATAAGGSPGTTALWAELTTLSDEYYQQLFEEECILIPRLWQPHDHAHIAANAARRRA